MHVNCTKVLKTASAVIQFGRCVSSKTMNKNLFCFLMLTILNVARSVPVNEIEYDDIWEEGVSNDAELETYNSTIKRSKFFGVGLVRFANSVCTSDTNLDGTCYRRRQCNDISGSPAGTCASGIGTCCVIVRTCGDSSSYNNTYFANEGFPETVTGSTQCIMTIERCNTDICQVRIDFLSLILAQPNATGYCTTDAMVITGGGGPVPVICGDNTGQHVYVDFNGNDTIQIAVTTSTTIFARLWSFKVTQIACACPTRAPAGCLMYYTSSSGIVNSFNYGGGSNVIDSTTGLPGTRQLVYNNYGVCIAMIPGYCSIQWSITTSGSFIVSGDVGANFGALNNGDCTTDFVIIPNPYYTDGTAVNSDRFCGTDFTTVVSNTKPFVLYVITNGDEVNDVANTGFSLTFTQVACANTLLYAGRK